MCNTPYCRIYMHLHSSPSLDVTSQCPWFTSSDFQAERIRNCELFKQSNSDSCCIHRTPRDRNRASLALRSTNTFTGTRTGPAPTMTMNYSKMGEGDERLEAIPDHSAHTIDYSAKCSVTFADKPSTIELKRTGGTRTEKCPLQSPQQNSQSSKS